jgi:hypothetical protein
MKRQKFSDLKIGFRIVLRNAGLKGSQLKYASALINSLAAEYTLDRCLAVAVAKQVKVKR